ENGLTLIFVQSRHGWGGISDENAQRSTRLRARLRRDRRPTKQHRDVVKVKKNGAANLQICSLTTTVPASKGPSHEHSSILWRRHFFFRSNRHSHSCRRRKLSCPRTRRLACDRDSGFSGVVHTGSATGVRSRCGVTALVFL